MLGGKEAWERATSWVDQRVTHAAGGTVEGVATTRVVSACLVAAIYFCLACSAAHVARDTLSVQFSTGLWPSIAPPVPAESAGFFRFPFPVVLSCFLFLYAMLSQADKKNE